MSPILLWIKSSENVERLRRLDNGDKRDSAPFLPNELQLRFSSKLERLTRLAKGDNNYSDPLSPI